MCFLMVSIYKFENAGRKLKPYHPVCKQECVPRLTPGKRGTSFLNKFCQFSGFISYTVWTIVKEQSLILSHSICVSAIRNLPARYSTLLSLCDNNQMRSPYSGILFRDNTDIIKSLFELIFAFLSCLLVKATASL